MTMLIHDNQAGSLDKKDLDIQFGWDLDPQLETKLSPLSIALEGLTGFDLFSQLLGMMVKVAKHDVLRDNLSEELEFPALFGIFKGEGGFAFSLSPALALTYFSMKTGMDFDRRHSLNFTEFEQNMLLSFFHEDQYDVELGTNFYIMAPLWSHDVVTIEKLTTMNDPAKSLTIYRPLADFGERETNVILTSFEISDDILLSLDAGVTIKVPLKDKNKVSLNYFGKKLHANLKQDQNGFYINKREP